MSGIKSMDFRNPPECNILEIFDTSQSLYLVAVVDQVQ